MLVKDILCQGRYSEFKTLADHEGTSDFSLYSVNQPCKLDMNCSFGGTVTRKVIVTQVPN